MNNIPEAELATEVERLAKPLMTELLAVLERHSRDLGAMLILASLMHVASCTARGIVLAKPTERGRVLEMVAMLRLVLEGEGDAIKH